MLTQQNPVFPVNSYVGVRHIKQTRTGCRAHTLPSWFPRCAQSVSGPPRKPVGAQACHRTFVRKCPPAPAQFCLRCCTWGVRELDRRGLACGPLRDADVTGDSTEILQGSVHAHVPYLLGIPYIPTCGSQGAPPSQQMRGSCVAQRGVTPARGTEGSLSQDSVSVHPGSWVREAGAGMENPVSPRLPG